MPTLLFRRASASSDASEKQRNDKQNEENEEQNLRDADGRRHDAEETENPGDNGYDQK
jgi:hypothetical protein